MAVTVGELLAMPHLQMSLHAGARGLDREVSWVHPSDLPNPWAWLASGELLLTNGTGLAADSQGQASFIERLAEAGPSAFGLGLGTGGPPLTRALTDRADELSLPVVSVPYSVPFSAVVRAVADVNEREEARQLASVARLYALLRTSMARGLSGPEMFGRLGRELDARLYLVDPETGLSLFEEGPETSFADALAAEFAAHSHAMPGVLQLRRRESDGRWAMALAVAVPGDQPTALVAEPTGEQLPSLGLLQHVATVGALELTQLAADRESRRRRGSDLLGQLLAGSGDAPSVAFHYPFAETPDAWVPIGLSDPDGSQNGQINDLNIAMRRAVVNALDFLQHDLGMDRAVAYAYLSAAADFEISQVVDRTVGVHGVIRKDHFTA